MCPVSKVYEHGEPSRMTGTFKTSLKNIPEVSSNTTKEMTILRNLFKNPCKIVKAD
jgi:hypothetical protein